MISEQEAREAAARLKNGGGDAFACWEDYQESSQKDEDVEVAANWICQELARREAERAERAKPVDAEWLKSIGFDLPQCNESDGMWFQHVVCYHVSYQECTVCNAKPDIKNRGQLLDLLAALRGTERPA